MMYEYWLAQVSGISGKRKKEMRTRFGDARHLYDAARQSEGGPFKKFLKEEEQNILIQSARTWDMAGEMEMLTEKGIRFLPWFDPDFPARLTQIPSPPYALYLRGELPDPTRPAVAMVGARSCTPYGEQMALTYGEALAKAGVVVVSGMALGIDGAAHRGALRAGGFTCAVLGSGVDVCYPRAHQGLYAELAEKGGLLSEFPPGAKPLAAHFPARNRLISGLSDVVLVMEARVKSGSLITADLALEQGRDVYALPGPVTSPLSQGCHRLIRQGAGILVSPQDLLSELSAAGIGPLDRGKRAGNKNEKTLESHQNIVYSFLGLFPKSIQELVAETHLSPSEVMNELVSLELMGKVREISKNHYSRTC